MASCSRSCRPARNDLTGGRPRRSHQEPSARDSTRASWPQLVASSRSVVPYQSRVPTLLPWQITRYLCSTPTLHAIDGTSTRLVVVTDSQIAAPETRPVNRSPRWHPHVAVISRLPQCHNQRQPTVPITPDATPMRLPQPKPGPIHAKRSHLSPGARHTCCVPIAFPGTVVGGVRVIVVMPSANPPLKLVSRGRPRPPSSARVKAA